MHSLVPDFSSTWEHDFSSTWEHARLVDATQSMDGDEKLADKNTSMTTKMTYMF